MASNVGNHRSCVDGWIDNREPSQTWLLGVYQQQCVVDYLGSSLKRLCIDCFANRSGGDEYSRQHQKLRLILWQMKVVACTDCANDLLALAQSVKLFNNNA